jgi:hypothetical protein
MQQSRIVSPLSQQDLIDEYFMEQRARIMDVAAFLDRLDRAAEQNGNEDFRLVAMRKALHELTGNDAGRVERVQMIFSDQNTDLLDELDRKAAYGASVR